MQISMLGVVPGFKTDKIQESASVLPRRLLWLRSEEASWRSRLSGAASTANYHQSRGLIKV